MRYKEEPKTKPIDIVIILCVTGLLAAALFLMIDYFSAPDSAPVEVVESNEGEAKALMIYELTGYEFPPEVAQWANVNFSGTTVSIETHSINLWDGKKWKELIR